MLLPPLPALGLTTAGELLDAAAAVTGGADELDLAGAAATGGALRWASKRTKSKFLDILKLTYC